MTVKDKIRRSSRIFMKPSNGKELFESENAPETTSAQSDKKSADYEDAKAVVSDKVLSSKTDETLEKATESVEGQTGVEAVKTKGESCDLDKTSDGQNFMERRKSFFRRKPSTRKTSDEGFAKKNLQRVLSRVKRPTNSDKEKVEEAANSEVQAEEPKSSKQEKKEKKEKKEKPSEISNTSSDDIQFTGERRVSEAAEAIVEAATK